MVRALSNKPALAAWEITKPEGSILIEGNSNPCYDTVKMGQYGAGWTNTYIPMERMLRFHQQQIGAIKRTDNKVLVTVGINFTRTVCLVGAGGDTRYVDFYQIHTYSWEGNWNAHSPFKVTAASFNLDKHWDIVALGRGSIIWIMDIVRDSQDAQDRGMQTIRSNSHNGLIRVPIN
ncbi:Mannan endo-1,4-beta-mannosidase [Orchesella cincta]|uniref:Mannan endo-1,4-beta-mannosidase n=1 Tax=Orchesella cincta TaxID=48709 RepID=A0A1D2M8E6_ORCCI|nr:Mannan endo-1,4-beta-mannosidase [Orchesella cincta]